EIDKKLADIDKKIKENEANATLETQYINLMNEAQNLETANNYEAAITKYKEASAKKPSESLPKKKIEELTKLIEDQKKSNAAQVEIDAKYNAEMKKGDDLMAQEKYLDAIQFYNKAGAIKPSEKDPVEKAALAEKLERDKNTDADRAYQKVLDA